MNLNYNNKSSRLKMAAKYFLSLIKLSRFWTITSKAMFEQYTIKYIN